MLSDIELFLFAPGGGWAYTYVRRPDMISVAAAIITAAVTIALWRLTEPWFSSRRWAAASAWVCGALVCQALYLAIAPFGVSDKVASVTANGFYSVSLEYSWQDYLGRFHEIRNHLPGHVRTNLPGKVLLMFALRAVSENTAVLAGLLVLLSSAGGAALYVVARQWYEDERVAMLALILYLFYPARIFFLPLMNTIAPLLMLLPIALAGCYLRTERLAWALACGVALAALLLFDPLPLFGGLCGLAGCIELARRRRTAPIRLLVGICAVAVPVVATYVVLFQAFHLDLIAAYRFSMTVAKEFNLTEQRPYGFWLLHNLKDFFFGLGPAASIAIALKFGSWRQGRGVTTAVAAIVTLLVLDGLGVNRGEVQRLWIFLGTLWLPLVAKAVAGDARLTQTALACAAVQVALCMRSIGWVIP